jgi:hypothetical protein
MLCEAPPRTCGRYPRLRLAPSVAIDAVRVHGLAGIWERSNTPGWDSMRPVMDMVARAVRNVCLRARGGRIGLGDWHAAGGDDTCYTYSCSCYSLLAQLWKCTGARGVSARMPPVSIASPVPI